MSPPAARTEQTRIAIEVAEGCATVGERVPGHRNRSWDAYVLRLRQKVGAVAPGVTFIHTHHATGYRLEPIATREERS